MDQLAEKLPRVAREVRELEMMICCDNYNNILRRCTCSETIVWWAKEADLVKAATPDTII